MNQPTFFDVDPEHSAEADLPGPAEGEPLGQLQAPSLSIDAVNPATLGSVGVVVGEQRGWHEVPQALFLSWPEARQLAYCAARDEVAAAEERDPLWKAFYAERAMHYRESCTAGRG